MARTTRTRSRHESSGNIKTWAEIIGILIATLGIIGVVLYNYFVKETVVLDPVSACPIVHGEATPVAHTVMIIDGTSSLSDLQSDYLRVKAKNLVKSEMKVGELLSVYFLTDDLQASRKPVFEMCKLRDGSDADALSENERLMKKHFEKRFHQPLVRWLKSITDNQSDSKNSPLFEIIQSASINSFDKWNVSGDRRLIVFSDMLQNTKKFSMYRKNNVDFAHFKKQPYASETTTHLPDVSVELYYLMNRPNLQNNRNTDFWKDYFRQTGALVETIVPVGK